MSFKYIIRRVAKFLRIIIAILLSFIVICNPNEICSFMLQISNSLLKTLPEAILVWFENSAIPYLFSIPDASLIISILGIFATVTVTFLTLLFAIAAINASFQAGKSGGIDSGAYPLKLLIKVDLQSTALKTIIPQLLFLVVAIIFQNVIPCIVWIGLLIILVVSLIRALWNTTNSVYYSIIQYNQDADLNAELASMNKIQSPSNVINYQPKAYDVYTIKKTLFPKLHKLIYKKLQKEDIESFSKKELVDEWDKHFKGAIEKRVEIIKYGLLKYYRYKRSKNPKKIEKKPLLLQIRSIRGKIVSAKMKPKIQAPDKVTKICLDMIYRDLNSGTHNLSKITLESCFILLYKNKRYIEKRQDERSKHNVKINRGRYANPDDTHMYMMYGYVLYLLGEFERGVGKYTWANQYYDAAIEAYECAELTNTSNTVAKRNIENTKKRKI